MYLFSPNVACRQSNVARCYYTCGYCNADKTNLCLHSNDYVMSQSTGVSEGGTNVLVNSTCFLGTVIVHTPQKHLEKFHKKHFLVIQS